MFSPADHEYMARALRLAEQGLYSTTPNPRVGCVVVKDGKVHLQAGAGLVADSDPTTEWQETVNKAMAVRRAIELAEKGLK